MSTSMRGRSLALLAVASLVLSLISASSAENISSKEPLPPGMEEIMGSSKYAHSWWGALVLDLDRNQTLLAINPDKMFVPASTTKLFTVAAPWILWVPIIASRHQYMREARSIPAAV